MCPERPSLAAVPKQARSSVEAATSVRARRRVRVWPLLLAGALGVAPPPAWGQPAGPLTPTPPPSVYESLPLPRDLGPERPLPPPPPLTGRSQDPSSGLHFGLGLPVLEVRSDALDARLEGGKPTAQGALAHVEGVWGAWRAGYARQWYRRDLPPGTVFEGAAAERLAFDSDQVWGFHGVRPAYGLYLGYGLGWQRRRVRVLGAAQPAQDHLGSSFMAGLMVDWAVGLPFLLQLRLFQDLSADDLLEARGASLQLSYIVPF